MSIKIKNLFFFLFLAAVFYFVVPLAHEIGHIFYIVSMGGSFELFYNILLPYSSYVKFFYITDSVGLSLSGAFFNLIIAVFIIIVSFILVNSKIIAINTFKVLVLIAFVFSFDIMFQICISFFFSSDFTILLPAIRIVLSVAMLVFYYCLLQALKKINIVEVINPDEDKK